MNFFIGLIHKVNSLELHRIYFKISTKADWQLTKWFCRACYWKNTKSWRWTTSWWSCKIKRLR